MAKKSATQRSEKQSGLHHSRAQSRTRESVMIGRGGFQDEPAPTRPDIDQQDIFIRGIVHDVNNNLMAIIGACDQLEESPRTIADLPMQMKLIRTHLHYISAQLRDLVNSHQMDKPVVMTMDELHHFMESIMPSLGLIAGNSTRIELGAVVTGPVHVHRKSLLRVLLQLARNVAETIDFGVDHPLAFISARQVGKWCEISVSDNGPGLVGLDAESVFAPGITTKGKDETRGYGLSSVARAVQDWGGEYGVDSIPNDTGCRFWIRLPLAFDH